MTMRETLAHGLDGHLEDHQHIHRLFNSLAVVPPLADNQADAQPAIQAAIQRIGYAALLPGVYRLSNPITNGSVNGAGVGQTTLRPDAGIDALQYTATGTGHCVTDLTIEGGAVGIAQRVTGAVLNQFSVQRVALLGQSVAGALVRGAMYSSLWDSVKADGLSGIYPLHGLLLRPTQGLNICTFINCTLRQCKTAGLRMDCSAQSSSGMTSWIGCRFESNWQNAVQLHRVNNVAFYGSYVENNGRDSEGGPYPDVIASAVSASHRTRRVAWYDTYNSGQANNRGGLFWQSLDEWVTEISFVNHTIGDTYRIDLGTGPRAERGYLTLQPHAVIATD